jgi:hypothetical protein
MGIFMTNKPEMTAAEYANLSPQERWAIDHRNNPINILTDPTVLLTRDPITGALVVNRRS